ncbi:MAG: ester cyclase [Actinocrinis sp.]
MPADNDAASIETTVRRLYAALGTGDASSADSILAADWQDIPHSPHAAPGVAGFRELIGFLNAAFADFSVTVDDVLVSGDRAAVRSTARGTHQGEVLGIPATGRVVEYRASDVHQVVDGRITVSWHLEDFFGLVSQLGATFSASASASA